MIYNILLIVQIIVALGIIGLVLIQHGKGADAGAAFGGGSSGTVFGSAGASNFLSRSTAILAAIFFANSLALAWIVSHSTGEAGSLVDSVKPTPTVQVEAAPAPVSDVPGGSAVPVAVPAAKSDVPAADVPAPSDVPATTQQPNANSSSDVPAAPAPAVPSTPPKPEPVDAAKATTPAEVTTSKSTTETAAPTLAPASATESSEPKVKAVPEQHDAAKTVVPPPVAEPEPASVPVVPAPPVTTQPKPVTPPAPAVDVPQ